MSFNLSLNKSIENILTGALSGKYPVVGRGLRIDLGESAVTATQPASRNIVVQEPQASIIIKKKEFSNFKHLNDLQWLDRTEKMYLRTVKALFAYKCAQIRAYEALTKFEQVFATDHEVPLEIFSDILSTAKFFETTDPNAFITNFEAATLFQNALTNSFPAKEYNDVRDDILKIAKRGAFQSSLPFTTWIVDPDNIENFGTGPGTGSMELGTFTNFSTSCDLNASPSSASVYMEDPYRITHITESEIELAIEEALYGTLGIINEIGMGTIDLATFDAKSVVGAAFEIAGGPLDTGIDTDYIRNQLRYNYMGKPFINAGDAISVFIRGNKTLQDYDDGHLFNEDLLAIDETILEAERYLYTDKKISFEDYKKIRSLQENSLAMQQVYGGVVLKTSRSFSSGFWSLSLECEDNMKWLDWSRFMIEPALQDPQGILEDPLTPYEIRTDALGIPLVGEGPKLIDENVELLNSGLLAYDSGIFNGQYATETNLLQGQYNQTGSASGTKIMQHANGFVYRWKTGIITATAGALLRDPLNEKDITLKMLNQTYGLSVAEDVLNNLDVANVLSLLIVGQPYNVESFMEQAYQAHNISKATSASSLSPTDPLTSVIDVIKRQNIRIGGFRPYRMITLSQSSLEETATSNLIRGELNEKIKLLRQRKIELSTLIGRLRTSDSEGNAVFIRTMNEELQAVQLGIQEQIKIANSTTLDTADLLTSNFNLLGRNRVLPLTGNFSADYNITRAMMIVGARRRIEDVRLNRDDNLFIVSDQYEENTDIRAYILKLRDSNYRIFDGNFISILEKCQHATKFINFEFFCNPQGHLEFRPPQWNRTPLSVLERLFQMSEEEGRTVIPPFLTQMFEDRSSSLRREVHGHNIQIVLLSLLLGRYPDSSLIPNFRDPSLVTIWKRGNEAITRAYLRFFGVNPEGLASGGDKKTLLRAGFTATVLGDLVNTGNQLIGDGLSVSFGTGEDGDTINADTSTILGIFDPIFQEEKNLVNNLLTTSMNVEGIPAIEYATAAGLNAVRDEFRKVGGFDAASGIIGNTQRFSEKDFVFFAGHDEGRRAGLIEMYLDELASTISSRDRLVTILVRNEEKATELDEINSILSGEFTEATGGDDGEFETPISDFIEGNIIEPLEKTATAIKTIKDIFTGEATKNSLFDHLVEDDTRNLVGPGSGRRFIIEDHDIRSCTFTETPPEFNRIDVVGDAPLGLGSALQSEFEDKYFWAGATDFDSWRQFGYISGGTKQLPFASDPELQCRPYAIMELQLQRTQINRGVVTVNGNEFYAPGDVVFIRDQGMLYYVTSVSHSFAFGGAFETQLNLENGHAPGIYLPSPIDIIGQELTKNFLEDGAMLVYRNQDGDDSYRALQPDSNLLFPAGLQVEAPDKNVSTFLDYKNNQVKYTNMMIDLNTITVGNRMILLRAFVKGDADVADVTKRLQVVRHLLENPMQISQTNGAGGDDLFDLNVNLNVNVGSSKELNTMILPNGLAASPVPSDRILEQIVYLDGTETTEFLCLNSQLLTGATLKDNIKAQIDKLSVDAGNYAAVFPKGGPKQSSWLDLRDDLTNITRIIEVGVLDVQAAIEDASSESGVSVNVDLGL
jgi:hypothetical protein